MQVPAPEEIAEKLRAEHNIRLNADDPMIQAAYALLEGLLGALEMRKGDASAEGTRLDQQMGTVIQLLEGLTKEDGNLSKRLADVKAAMVKTHIEQTGERDQVLVKQIGDRLEQILNNWQPVAVDPKTGEIIPVAPEAGAPASQGGADQPVSRKAMVRLQRVSGEVAGNSVWKWAIIFGLALLALNLVVQVYNLWFPAGIE